MLLFPTRTIAISIGPIAVHWYGVMYALAFLLGAWLLPRLLSYRRLVLSAKQRESLFIATFLGVILGGRLGYVLFYGGTYYLSHPLEILAVWRGGMASHGGFIGVAVALWIFSRRHQVNLLALLDVLVVPIAIGLAFGRLGNLINGELYGTVTTMPWGLRFPDVEGLRHPTQIYAIVKDLLIAAVCFFHLRWSAKRQWKPGRTTAIFLVLYCTLRFIVEFYREQPMGFVHVLGLRLSEGQVLTVIISCFGMGFLVNSRYMSER